MPRPREYEPEVALDRAMRLFWEQGYDGTSMADLVEATGVSRYGFYSELGDKTELFVRCVDRYSRVAIGPALQPLERPAAGVAEIRSYFERALAAANDGEAPTGCLIGNAAISSTHLDAAVAARIGAHYERLRQAFLVALRNAGRTGEIACGGEEALADYLVGVTNGMLACLRAGLSPAATANYVRVSLERLEQEREYS